MKAFTHASDLDGAACAAIVKYFKPQAEIIPIDYGQEFPWGSLAVGEEVYMLDFCLQPFAEMLRLRDKVNLIWIDHHQTSYEAMMASGVQFHGQQLGKGSPAACELAWKYFAWPSVPRALQLLSLWDIWNHEDPQVVAFQMGFRIEDTSPESNIWHEHVFRENQEAWIQEVCLLGKKLVASQERANAQVVKQMSFETTFEGYRALAINRHRGGTDFFKSLATPEIDIFLAFTWIPAGKWTISIYSNKPEIDVSAIAKKYEGGGHFGAAGFQAKKLPFEPWLEKYFNME